MLVNLNNLNINDSRIKSIINKGNSVIRFELKDKVEDEIRGYLTYQSNHWEFILSNDYVNKNKTKKIAMVLESPHKHEYQEVEETIQPIAPAQHITGRNIEREIATICVAWELDCNFDYEVNLVNAIQYQTSCYHSFLKPNKINRINTELRNNMFLYLWKNEKLSLDFSSRIEAYQPDIIINACTGNIKKANSLKRTVDEEILNMKFININNYYLCAHPSRYWFWKKKSKLRKLYFNWE